MFSIKIWKIFFAKVFLADELDCTLRKYMRCCRKTIWSVYLIKAIYLGWKQLLGEFRQKKRKSYFHVKAEVENRCLIPNNRGLIMAHLSQCDFGVHTLQFVIFFIYHCLHLFCKSSWIPYSEKPWVLLLQTLSEIQSHIWT